MPLIPRRAPSGSTHGTLRPVPGIADREPRVARVYETVLYAADVRAAAAFYADVLGLRPLEEPDEHSAVFRLTDGGVLLLFDPARSELPGRLVPSHGARGPGHVALSVEPGMLEAFAERLRNRGVEIEHEQAWSPGGRSLYVRDPVGNSVELVEGEVWPDGKTD
jgi:catechol 2,3-dioxygenase-like lactoylglutathione lyase family enzyme